MIAIRIDEFEVASSSDSGKTVTTAVLTRAEAEARHPLDGPPYGAVEVVFDEAELDAREPAEPSTELRFG